MLLWRLWVASHVLGRTLEEQNRLANHNERMQRELAESAAIEQDRLAQKQLTEQRTALGRQLYEQRKGLEQQLAEQRREASLNREHAAIAEVIGVLSETITAVFGSSNNDGILLTRLAAGIGRWQLESMDIELRNELSKWPSHWWLSISAVRAPEASGDHRGTGAVDSLRDIKGIAFLRSRLVPR